jgi:7-cyano-7-deazaguanine synthase
MPKEGIKKLNFMNTILIYSGGLDSTVLLYQLLDAKAEVACLTIDYGQRHRVELECARKICNSLKLEHKTVDLRSITGLLGGSSLTDASIEVPEGHYEEMTMKATVVPNRNMIMLSLATGWAISRKADSVAYAAHCGDHAIYPDCREVFVEAMNNVIALADWHKLSLYCPFQKMNKRDIVIRGMELGVPFKDTWSCYQGKEKHCGRCGTCIERREAFHLAGLVDPTEYADQALSVDEMVGRNWRF